MLSNEKTIQFYISRFIELNNEERELIEHKKYSNLEDFYDKKNEVADDFIEDVNNGIIDTSDVIITYLEQKYDTDTIYYDKIFIDLEEEGNFVILPPIAALEGRDKLYNFMSKHIDYTIKYGQEYRGGPFPWSNVKSQKNNTITSRKEFNNYIKQCDYAIEKYAELLSDDLLADIEKQNQKLENELDQYITAKASKYGLSDEQVSWCLDILEIIKTEAEKEVVSKTGWIQKVGKDWDIDNIERVLIGMIKHDDISSIEKIIYEKYDASEFADACIEPYDLEQDLGEYLYFNLRDIFEKMVADGKIAVSEDIYRDLESKYKVSDIKEGLEDLKHSEIEKIIEETNQLARENSKEETIEQKGQTQADE